MTRHTHSGYGSDQAIGDMTVGDYANGMPNIRLGEMFRSFGRQLRWVIPLFLIGAIPAWYVTKDIKRTYEGVGSLLVQPGEEHLYSPITTSGQQGSGIVQGPDSITNAEIAIMKNNTVIEQVIGEMVSKYGESRFNKKAFEKINKARRSGDAVALANARVDLHKSIEKSFQVAPRPKTGVIDLVYKHEDGEIAKETLNAFISSYKSYRQTLFVEGAAEVFAKRRTATEEQLNDVERQIQSFLRKNGISDFDSERGGATTRTEALRAELNTTRSQMAEAEAGLAAVEDQLRNTPAQIDLYVDDRGSQRVAQAELELKQLLAKYLPGSDPVRAKEAEIMELQSLQRANEGRPIGGRRVGPNATHQALMTQYNQLRAAADSYREKEFTIQQLLGSADSKVKKLQLLSPDYNNLLRKRETLDQRLSGYTNKEQEALVNQEQAEANSENVKVISYATLPRKGRNMQKIMFALIMIGWGFTLFMFALLKVFLDPKLYTDPTRRVRGRRSSDDFEYNDYGRDVPMQQPARPYVPEPVPMQPAAAQYQSQYQSPYQDPYAQPGYNQQAGYSAVPYAAAGGAALDMNYAQNLNPYAQPSVQTEPPMTGELPSSEID